MILGLLGRFLARSAVADWIIRRAMKTPYTHIYGPDGSTYMERYWVFNAYGLNAESRDSKHNARFNCLPSIRVHRIMLPDSDRHLHDHPWNARTFILKGCYRETRLHRCADYDYEQEYVRRAGDTASLQFGEYHAIEEVSDGGTWTLFCTWKYQGTWGFLVNGAKVPWRDYLAEKEKEKA